MKNSGEGPIQSVCFRWGLRILRQTQGAAVVNRHLGAVILASFIATTLTGCSVEVSVPNGPVPPAATPASLPSLLAFTSGLTNPPVGLCSPYTITSQDSSLQTRAVLSSTQVTLYALYAGNTSGSFYSDSGCSSSITSTTIPAGQSSVTVYFEDIHFESTPLLASATGFTSGLFSVTTAMNSASASQLLVNGPSTAGAGSCSSPYTVSSIDAIGNAASLSATVPTTINLDAGGENLGGAFFSDAACSVPISSVTIAANATYSSLFYFRASNVGSVTVTAASSSLSTVFSITAYSVTPTQLIIVGPSAPTYNTCVSYVIYTQDPNGNLAPVSSATTVTLAGKGSGGFYSNDTCSTSISSISIAANADLGIFFFKDTVIENLLFTAIAAGLNYAALPVTPSPGASGLKLAFSGLPAANLFPITCTGPISIVSENLSGALTNVTATVTATLASSGTGSFYNSGTCTTPTTSVSLLINTNTSSTTVYYKDTTTQEVTLTAVDSTFSVASASQSAAVGTTTSVQLAVTGPATTPVGTCTTYTVTSEDIAGIAKNATTTVTLSGAGEGSFYTTGACNTPTTTLSLAAASSANFYFKTSKAQSALNFTATATNFISGTLPVSALAGSPASILVTGPNALPANTCSPLGFTIQQLDSTGNLASDGSSRTYTLAITSPSTSAAASGTFYSDAICTTPLAPALTATIASSSSSINAYFKSSTLGDIHLVVTDSSTALGSNNMNFSVDNAPTQISAAESSNGGCALMNGGVWCWGFGSGGQLGNNSHTYTLSNPEPVPGLSSGVIAVSSSYSNGCALLSGGTVQCWGDNTYGQIGNGVTATSGALMPTTVLNSAGTTALSGVTAISVGNNWICAVVAGGLQCWGIGTSGQLGNGRSNSSSLPVSVFGLGAGSGVTSVSIGGNTGCAVVNGGIQCWGIGTSGQLGNGTTVSEFIPVQTIAAASGVTQVSVGTSHACAVINSGIECWGLNSNGQLGDTTTTNRTIPTQVWGLPSGSNVMGVAAGATHTCAIVNGAAQCWGNSSSGRLGINFTPGVTANVPYPVGVVGLGSGITSVVAGGAFSCAIANGTFQCWGDNSLGELGTGSLMETSAPVETVGLGAGPTQVSLGSYHACAIIAGGSVQCWGQGTNDQLGNNNNTVNSSTAVQVSGLTLGATQVAAGYIHTCAIVNGGVECWGTNSTGQLGNTSLTSSLVPTSVFGLGAASGATAISTKVNTTCALVNGGVECWGDGTYGQLGNGTSGTGNLTVSPVQVTGLSGGVTAISVGRNHVCALISGGVECWGQGASGQLGNGGTSNSSVPASVPGLSAGVTAISSGAFFSCALLSTGAVECWGNSDFNGLHGNGAAIDSLTPTQVPGLGAGSGTTALALGSSHACAIVNGGLQCWGSNLSGELGVPNVLSNNSQSIVPIANPAFTSGVTAIGAGNFATCAIASGNLSCWGANTLGKLGDGELLMFPIPQLVSQFK